MEAKTGGQNLKYVWTVAGRLLEKMEKKRGAHGDTRVSGSDHWGTGPLFASIVVTGGGVRCEGK